MIPKHFEIARAQFQVEKGNFFRNLVASNANKKELVYSEKNGVLNFKTSKIAGSFDLNTGELTSYHLLNMDSFIDSYPTPYFWKAPTDNDFGNNMPNKLNIWKNAYKSPTVEDIKVGKQTNEGIPIKVTMKLAKVNVTYKDILVCPEIPIY